MQAPGRVSLQKLGEQLGSVVFLLFLFSNMVVDVVCLFEIGVKEASEAEMWLLRAVSDGLVKVKINQLDNTVFLD